MQRKVDSSVDFQTVLTKEDLRTIDEDKLSFIRKEANAHSNYLRSAFQGGTLIEILASRSRELAFIGNKYRNLSNAEKELLAANIAFSNDESFIKALLSKGITYNHLYHYSRAISSIKKVASLANKLELDDDVKLTSKKINALCSLIRLHFGIRDYNLIIAKINDIVVFKKDLYKKLEQDQLTPSSKTR